MQGENYELLGLLLMDEKKIVKLLGNVISCMFELRYLNIRTSDVLGESHLKLLF